MSSPPPPADEDNNRILVFLRIRPPKKGDPLKNILPEINPTHGTTHLMDVQPDNKTVLLTDGGGKSFNFDHVWAGAQVEQEEVYEKVARPVVHNSMNSYSSSLICYGQTGSGKSHTMCTWDKGNEGIIPRAMRQIFDTISKDPSRDYTVKFSFIQIYCDRLQDLFNPAARSELRLNRDAKTGVSFPGIVEHTIHSEEDFREKYEDGNQHRVVAKTKMNDVSSRGHAALFIQVQSQPSEDGNNNNDDENNNEESDNNETRNGKLFLIDLAGYEKFLGAAETGGDRKLREEARAINASLLSLGNVVQSLAEGSDFVPWRNTKLTRMLQDAIGGKAKCSIILTAGPSSEYLYETMQTLHFGTRAMSVKTKAEKVINLDFEKMAKKYKEMLSIADSKINTLETEVARRDRERIEMEFLMQKELLAMKQRHQEQLQDLLARGGTPEEIQKLIDANATETEVVRGQHEDERSLFDHRSGSDDNENDNNESENNNNSPISSATTTETIASEGVNIRNNEKTELRNLRRELQETKQQLNQQRQVSQDAQAENRRLSTLLSDTKINNATGGTNNNNNNNNNNNKQQQNNSEEAQNNARKQIAEIRLMLEEQHAAKLAEHLDPLQDELNRYKKGYEELRATVDEELQVQKDTLTQLYETEIREMREISEDVQEKLKKNHMIIKKSYQKQKEELQSEVENLTSQLARLTEDKRTTTTDDGKPKDKEQQQQQQTKAPSLAEMMVAKKKLEKQVQDLNQELQDMKTEITYSDTEKQSLRRQLSEFAPKPGESDQLRAMMKPAVVRKLKADKEAAERELFKMKAEKNLLGFGTQHSGVVGKTTATTDKNQKTITASSSTSSIMPGDFEGIEVFTAKMLKFAYLSGAQKILNSNHQAVLGSLTRDLDEARRSLRLHFYFLGNAGSGKSAALKCLTASTTPLRRSCPETTPTLFPSPTSFSVEDPTTSKTDLFKRYINFENLQECDSNDDNDNNNNTAKKSSSLLSGIASAVGLNKDNAVSDPSRIYIETLDFPGNQTFFRGFPSYLLPSKNAMYIITYNLTQPVAIIAEDIGIQLRNIHAAVHHNQGSSPLTAAVPPRVAVCLLGTHRDAMRDSRDSSVIAFLNKINVAIGAEFYKLCNNEDSKASTVGAGLQVVGNFATSARDWTVLSAKSTTNAPQNWRDLFAYLATLGQKLYENTPSSFLPAKKNTAAFTSYMLMNDDNINSIQTAEKTHLMDPLEQRMRKGVVTFLTALHREQKVRWLMGDKEMRSLIAEHLDVDGNTAVGQSVINHIIREIRVRNIVTILPTSSSSNEDGSLIVLDPNRLLNLYSVFIGGQWIPKQMSDNQLFKELVTKKNPSDISFDLAALDKQLGPLDQGILTQECAQVLLNRFIPMVGSSPRLLFELLCVMGLGTGLRSENAMLAPSHIVSNMPVRLTGYISYLISNYGCGLGRKYQLRGTPESFFTRVQTALVPFGNAPTKDAESLNLNFKDGCFLIFEKSRLKWGTYGSKPLKDTIVNIGNQAPIRGIIKLEGDALYFACAAHQQTDSSSQQQQQQQKEKLQALVRSVMDAVHNDIILSLCENEFPGMSASFLEMEITNNNEEKKSRLPEGIRSYIQSLGGNDVVVQEQINIIGKMDDFETGREIDRALKALPVQMLDPENEDRFDSRSLMESNHTISSEF